MQVAEQFSQQMYAIAQHLKRGEPEAALEVYQGLAGSSSIDEVGAAATIAAATTVTNGACGSCNPAPSQSHGLKIMVVSLPRSCRYPTSQEPQDLVLDPHPCPLLPQSQTPHLRPLDMQSGAALMAVKSLINCVKTQKKTIGWVP